MPELISLKNDPARQGFLTERKQERAERLFVQVRFPDGLQWVPVDQIEPVADSLSPIDWLEQRKLARPVDLRRTLTHVKLSGRLADIIYSMEATNTDFYAYQFKPVIKILESPNNGILIADEVGLGKTIEAGLVWTELRSRFDMRRMLVLCPAALREKWWRELSNKFGVDAHICDAAEVLQRFRDEEAQARGFVLIASVQGLRPPRNWEDDQNNAATAELARFLSSQEHEQPLLDLLVIDEAHHLRNPETKNNKLGQLARDVAEYLILLTATPVHNRNEDLFSLLRFLDPDTFLTNDIFKHILEANEPLVHMRDHVLRSTMDAQGLHNLLNQVRRNPLFDKNRQLASIEENGITPELLTDRNARSRLAYQLERASLWAHVVTRTLKRDVKEWRVWREPFSEAVMLAPVEEEFYSLVTEVVEEYAFDRDTSAGFLLIQPQRQMTSSMAASLRLWQRKLVELEDGDEDNNSQLGPLVTEIVLRSRDYVELEQLIRVDTKYIRLRKILKELLDKSPVEKIVVFSSFRATLDYLAERLIEDGISCTTLKGGQSETNDVTIQRFSAQDGASVLLSSEVGAEGVDLQFSRMLINYDLPWNPMRLEQRIGRIDRLGQKAEKVLIWNIFYDNTIDSRIYRCLYEKLDLCRRALGDFEEILGDHIRKLTLDLLRLTPDQQEKRIEQTAQALANLRLEETNLEENAAHLIAHGDYILRHVHAARELSRWISGDDLRRYVFDYLKLYYPDTELMSDGADSSTCKIRLAKEARTGLASFVDRKRFAVRTKLTLDQTIRCRFKNHIGGAANRSEETITQFHPLVRWISHNIEADEKQTTPAVALVLSYDAHELAGRFEPGIYVLAAALWSFQALQDTEKLAYAAAPLNASADFLEPDNSERLAVAAIASGKDWLEARNTLDFDLAYQVAKDLFGHLYNGFEEFSRDLQNRNEDRADVQIRTLEQHLKNKKEQLENPLQGYREKKQGAFVKKMTEGKIRKLEERISQRRAQIEEKRKILSRSREIAVAVIAIQLASQ